MMTRGTTRKAVSVRGTTYTRLEAYLAEKAPGETKSGFLEKLLASVHPEVFGEGAPLPPEPTAEEIEETRRRQTRARQLADARKIEPFFPGTSVEKEVEKEVEKAKKPLEYFPEVDRSKPKRPPPHLQPKPEPKKTDDDTDPDMPPSVILL